MTIQDDNILDDVLVRIQRIWGAPAETESFKFEFELRRLEKVIRAFCRTEPIQSFYLLGLTATLRDDAVATRSHFTNALRHSCQDPDVRRGYGACLVRLRYFAEAREQYEAIFAQDGKDLHVLAELIITSLATGRIQDGVRWIQHWSELNPDRPFEEAESIAKNSELLEKFGISDDHVERLQTLALRILERECRSIKTINYRGVPLDDPEWIMADFVVEESAEVVRDLNGKLSSAITRTPTPHKMAEVVKFSYSTSTKSLF